MCFTILLDITEFKWPTRLAQCFFHASGVICRFFLCLLCFHSFSFSDGGSSSDFVDFLKKAIEFSPELRQVATKTGLADSYISEKEADKNLRIDWRTNFGLTQEHQPTGQNDYESANTGIFLEKRLREPQIKPAVEGYKSLKKAFSAEYEQKMQEVLYAAVESYLRLKQARDSMAISRNNYKISQRHFQATKARYEGGELTLTDVNQAEARMNINRAEMMLSEGAVEAEEVNFRRRFGIKPSATLPEWKGFSTAALKKAVLKRNLAATPVLSINSYLTEVEQKRIDQIRAETKPTLNLRGSGQRDWRLSGNIATPRDRFDLLFSFNVSLRDGGVEKAKVSQAEFLVKELQEKKQELLLDAEKELEQADVRLRNSMQALDVFAKSVKSAEAALEGVLTEYQVGTRTAQDFLEMQRELFSAYQGRLNAEFSVDMNKLAVVKALGLLNLDALEKEKLW
jgi:outer membrane protein